MTKTRFFVSIIFFITFATFFVAYGALPDFRLAVNNFVSDALATLGGAGAVVNTYLLALPFGSIMQPLFYILVGGVATIILARAWNSGRLPFNRKPVNVPVYQDKPGISAPQNIPYNAPLKEEPKA